MSPAALALEDLRPHLVEGIAALGQTHDEDVISKLCRYLELLVTWNSAYNLSGIRDPHEMLHRHILDSLSILPLVTGPRVLDIGTGAGLPGIPLAICLPEAELHLLDANGKKMRFLFEVKTQLGLKNVSLLHGRAEECAREPAFDTVVSRAVGTLAELLRLGGPLMGPEGRLLAMKSAPRPEELEQVKPPYTVCAITELSVPGVPTPRHLVCIARLPGKDGTHA